MRITPKLSAVAIGFAVIGSLVGCTSSANHPSELSTNPFSDFPTTQTSSAPAPSAWSKSEEQSEYNAMVAPTKKALATFDALSHSASLNTYRSAATKVENAETKLVPPLTYGLWADTAKPAMNNLVQAVVTDSEFFGRISNATSKAVVTSMLNTNTATDGYAIASSAVRTAIGLAK